MSLKTRQMNALVDTVAILSASELFCQQNVQKPSLLQRNQ